ncbi:DegT/DnrJ/EryC1/StrS family aminotransferase [Thiobacillus sp.]|uniref:DegT/DnrJ/EryC1/StrS family aminotransferase n=1 Tax=Thiobacillus sp. TaxID=924 RepID=UPI003428E473
MVPVNSTTRLERCVAELAGRNEAVAVGRAAWGLFALLSLLKRGGEPQRIALPSFLCQSPLAATLLAGWRPEFCDVDPATGNVPDAEWMRVIEAGVQAVLFVHLFGNIGNAGRIAELCHARGIFFIEDAAQSFGGNWEGRPCGSHGDAAIVSFGHTKLIDVGHGGMVLANDRRLANEIREFESNSSGRQLNEASVAKQFRELFYAARRQLGNSPDRAREAFGGLIRVYEPLLPTRWKPEVATQLLIRLGDLVPAVAARREKFEIYRDALRSSALIPLAFSGESVPWRAVFRLPGAHWSEQEMISEAVRAEGVDISNWYIPSHWLMERPGLPAGALPSTERLSQEIFQLWLDDRTGPERVRHAAHVMVRKLEEAGYG